VPAAGIRPLRAGDAEREGKPAARRQALDPAVRRPRNGEIHVDAVGRDFGPAGAVAMDNADIAAAGKEGLGPSASAASNSTAVTSPLEPTS
jgi:hypothetical protein